MIARHVIIINLPLPPPAFRMFRPLSPPRRHQILFIVFMFVDWQFGDSIVPARAGRRGISLRVSQVATRVGAQTSQLDARGRLGG